MSFSKTFHGQNAFETGITETLSLSFSLNQSIGTPEKSFESTVLCAVSNVINAMPRKEPLVEIKDGYFRYETSGGIALTVTRRDATGQYNDQYPEGDFDDSFEFAVSWRGESNLDSTLALALMEAGWDTERPWEMPTIEQRREAVAKRHAEEDAKRKAREADDFAIRLNAHIAGLEFPVMYSDANGVHVPMSETEYREARLREYRELGFIGDLSVADEVIETDFALYRPSSTTLAKLRESGLFDED